MGISQDIFALFSYADLVNNGQQLYVPKSNFRQCFPGFCKRIKIKHCNGYYVVNLLKGAEGLAKYFRASKIFYAELNSKSRWWLGHLAVDAYNPFRDEKEIFSWQANLFESGWAGKQDTINNTLKLLTKVCKKKSKLSLESILTDIRNLPVPKHDRNKEIEIRNKLTKKIESVCGR